MDMIQFVPEQLLILAGALYVIGYFLKQTPNVKDYLIPWTLMFAGIGFSIAIMGVNANSILQGIIVSFTAVGTNQLVKQTVNKN